MRKRVLAPPETGARLPLGRPPKSGSAAALIKAAYWTPPVVALAAGNVWVAQTLGLPGSDLVRSQAPVSAVIAGTLASLLTGRLAPAAGYVEYRLCDGPLRLPGTESVDRAVERLLFRLFSVKRATEPADRADRGYARTAARHLTNDQQMLQAEAVCVLGKVIERYVREHLDLGKFPLCGPQRIELDEVRRQSQRSPRIAVDLAALTSGAAQADDDVRRNGPLAQAIAQWHCEAREEREIDRLLGLQT